MGQITYTWDELIEGYGHLHGECQERLRTDNDGMGINQSTEQHLAQHALGMMRLIPKLRELPDLNETDKWTSHFALVMNSTAGLYSIYVSFDRDPDFVNLEFHTPENSSNQRASRVREANVVSNIQDFLKTIGKD